MREKLAYVCCKVGAMLLIIIKFKMTTQNLYNTYIISNL